jgi:UDP-3-O-[3-hydroxymyristoyl] glucosamine N-acyltransferase
MSAPSFFRRACAPSLREIVAWTQAEASPEADLDLAIAAVAPLDQAGPGTLSFLDNPRYLGQLERTRATACFVSRKYAARTPEGTLALISAEPYRAFAVVLGKLFPDALRPDALFATTGVSPGSFVHPEARLEPGVVVDPGVVVGARAEVGSGTRIAAHAVIGPDVKVGRDCSIGAHVSIMHALIGDRVILHPGVRIGQDGFGFAMSPQGHSKVPQIGRVIVQSDVEIGANATVDRGATRDTVIGEGTKIDNLVQIAHNVTIGRHCVIVAQVGVSGSTEIGDFVAIGGQAGLTGHLRIGAGAQIGAQSGVMADVPAGERWAGSPAIPARLWLRAHALVERLARTHKDPRKTSDPSSEEP